MVVYIYIVSIVYHNIFFTDHVIQKEKQEDQEEVGAEEMKREEEKNRTRERSHE